jgi:hypothetical protein
LFDVDTQLIQGFIRTMRRLGMAMVASSSIGGGRLVGCSGRRRGGRLICLIKVAVLGFFFCKDGDLPEACPSSSGRSDKFQKAPPVNVTVQLMPGVCCIGWYSVVHPQDFIPTVWFWRERREAMFCVAIR